jgi:hypothetical protein
MTKHADITVYDSNNNLQLVVEVKNQPDASADWATQMRRNWTRTHSKCSLLFTRTS